MMHGQKNIKLIHKQIRPWPCSNWKSPWESLAGGSCCCYSHMTVAGFVIKLSPYSIKLRDIEGMWEGGDSELRYSCRWRGLLHTPVTAA